MNFLDLFSGIGGFRFGMEGAGHTCIGHVEIDKFANASYEAIFKEGGLIGTDITQISDEQWKEYKGRIDCLCGGFPCQAFSIAGQQKGFEDTRGTLFFEICRAAKEIQPSYLFLENVKNLLSHNEGKTFEVMLKALDELGYNVEWCVLNSKNFGVPQNRERVFIIGHLRGRSTTKVFSFRGNVAEITRKPEEIEGVAIPVLTPERINKKQNGRRFKENGEPSFTLTTQDRHGVIVQIGNIKDVGYFGGNPQVGRIYSAEGIAPCLNTMQGGGREPKILANINPSGRGMNGNVFNVKTSSPTLTTNKGEGFKIAISDKENKNLRIRKLTPRECWRLQGFPDWAFDRARQVNSDSQLYKQAGNSVTVNVIEWIAERLKINE